MHENINVFNVYYGATYTISLLADSLLYVYSQNTIARVALGLHLLYNQLKNKLLAYICATECCDYCDKFQGNCRPSAHILQPTVLHVGTNNWTITNLATSRR